MIKSNRIPRKFYKLYITMLIETSAAAPGDRATVYRDEYNELIMETESGKKYRVFISMLRNPEVVRIDRIAENDPATEEQKNKERAFLSDYIIEARDSAKIERLLKDTSNRAELFWEEVRAIAGNLSDHAQSRYQVLAEALYTRRFTAPTAPAAEEAEQTPTESHSAPQSATETATAPAEEITPEETPKKYVFRIYENWTVYAGRLSESIITAGSDQEAQEIAIRLAEPHGETQTGNTAEARRTPAETRGGRETTNTPPTDAESPTEARSAPTATAGSTAANAPGLQANKASPNAA